VENDILDATTGKEKERMSEEELKKMIAHVLAAEDKDEKAKRYKDAISLLKKTEDAEGAAKLRNAVTGEKNEN
jgi:hypothetical protein